MSCISVVYEKILRDLARRMNDSPRQNPLHCVASLSISVCVLSLTKRNYSRNGTMVIKIRYCKLLFISSVSSVFSIGRCTFFPASIPSPKHCLIRRLLAHRCGWDVNQQITGADLNRFGHSVSVNLSNAADKKGKIGLICVCSTAAYIF